MTRSDELHALLEAIAFAAEKHRHQRRKDPEASPYINHPIEVARLLVDVGEVTDLTTLQAAILHDTIEDTETTLDELEERFGPDVRALVEEMTDEKTLPKALRKDLQVKHAYLLSSEAKMIKIADKIANVYDVAFRSPAEWPAELCVEYLDWTKKVVAGCRGVSPALEDHYDVVLARARAKIADYTS